MDDRARGPLLHLLVSTCKMLHLGIHSPCVLLGIVLPPLNAIGEFAAQNLYLVNLLSSRLVDGKLGVAVRSNNLDLRGGSSAELFER